MPVLSMAEFAGLPSTQREALLVGALASAGVPDFTELTELPSTQREYYLYLAAIAAGSSGGNATVPVDAVILPPQAFVDNVTKFTRGGNYETTSGMTHVADSWIQSQIGDAGLSSMLWNGNSLDAQSVNSVLAATLALGYTSGMLQLAGTNAAPTGQGVIDKAALELAGWTVLTN